jgi:hypothetical protein
MLSDIYKPIGVECRYAEYGYAECRSALQTGLGTYRSGAFMRPRSKGTLLA